MPEYKCLECGVGEGEYHELPCGYEICPFCGGRLCNCDCDVRQLGLYNEDVYPRRTGHLPEEIFDDGLNPVQESKWLGLLAGKGRIPYMHYGFFCDRCGCELDDDDHIAVDNGVLDRNYCCTDCAREIWIIMEKTTGKRVAWIDSVLTPAIYQTDTQGYVAQIMSQAASFPPEQQKEYVADRLVAYLQSKLIAE